MFAAPEFDDSDFRSAPLGFDGCAHPNAFDVRGANLDLIPVSDHQHRVELHGGAFLDFEFLDLQDLPFGHPVLFAPGFDHSVHLSVLQNDSTIPTEEGGF